MQINQRNKGSEHFPYWSYIHPSILPSLPSFCNSQEHHSLLHTGTRPKCFKIPKPTMDGSPPFPLGKTKVWNSRGGLRSPPLIGCTMPSHPHVPLGNISKYFWASWKQLCWRGREGLLIPYRFHILRRVPSPPICRPISGNQPSAGNFTLALPIVQRFPSCQMIGTVPAVNFTPAVC